MENNRNKNTIDNLRKENRMLRHNNELMIKRDVAILRAISDMRNYAKEQQYSSVINLQNKMRKTLAELDEQLESLN